VIRSSGNVISEVQVAFSVMPVAHPVSDDASCSGLSVYDLTQKDVEALGNQPPDKFVVSYYGSMTDASAGTNFLPNQYPAQSGTQTIYVRVSSIDNPKCYDVSQSFQLVNLETPILDFPLEAYLCHSTSGVTIGETAPNPNYSYVWDSGQTTPAITVSQEGSYRVTATYTESGLSCSDSKTISVAASQPPQIIDVEIEDLRNNNTVTVSTNLPDGLEYRLDNGEYQKGNKFYQVTPGIHTITVNDPKGCGNTTEEIVVVGFPKFFTPNGDGSNDFWHISGIENLSSPAVEIYNRFGKLLLQLDSNSSGWNGTVNGKPLPETDYWFKLTYEDEDGRTVAAKYVNNHFALKR
ncbi:MAG: T9SS type B sorting domain-containing protein, partial [Pricia sp.]|nr:T9SS type B sorting domain-containing protein [Pricia sp.]